MKIEAVKEWEALPYSMRAAELAKALNIGVSSAYEMMNMPGFPAVRLGKTKIVTMPALNYWLKANQAS